MLTLVTLCSYFTYSAVAGNHGLLNRSHLELQEIRLIKDHKIVQEKVLQLENKTRRLSNDYLDLELLDQQVRSILGFARPTDIIFR